MSHLEPFPKIYLEKMDRGWGDGGGRVNGERTNKASIHPYTPHHFISLSLSLCLVLFQTKGLFVMFFFFFSNPNLSQLLHATQASFYCVTLLQRPQQCITVLFTSFYRIFRVAVQGIPPNHALFPTYTYTLTVRIYISIWLYILKYILKSNFQNLSHI